MTFRLAEAFVGYTAIGDTADSGWANSGCAYSPTSGRFGLGGVTVPYNASFTHGVVPVASVNDYVIAQFAIKWDAGARTKEGGVVKFGNNGGANLCCYIKRMPNDSLQVWDANNVLAGSTAPNKLPSGQWHVIVIKAQIGKAPGSVDVYINNMVTPALSLVGVVDLLAGGAVTGCDFIAFERNAFDDAAAGAQYTLSESFFYDTEGAAPWNGSPLLGDKRLYPLQPDADDSSAWSIFGDVSSYATVNDALNATHDGDGTYNFTGVLALDEMQLPNLTAGVAGIVGVVSVLTAKKSNGGAEVGALNHRIRSNASVGLIPTGALTDGYLNYQGMYLLDPNGNVPWTPAAINGLFRVGYRVL